jgi:hypothetical protein
MRCRYGPYRIEGAICDGLYCALLRWWFERFLWWQETAGVSYCYCCLSISSCCAGLVDTQHISCILFVLLEWKLSQKRSTRYPIRPSHTTCQFHWGRRVPAATLFSAELLHYLAVHVYCTAFVSREHMITILMRRTRSHIIAKHVQRSFNSSIQDPCRPVSSVPA